MTFDQALEIPAVAKLFRTAAIGVARWSEKTRNDVQTARIQALADDTTFVLRLSPRGTGNVAFFRSIITSTLTNAQRFLQHNPDAPDALMALANWAVARINAGTVRFDTSWSPGSEGFLAITAVAAPPKAS